MTTTMTEKTSVGVDLRFCEVCQTSSTTILDDSARSADNFILCEQGHKLFPAKCDGCHLSWDAFVKERGRIRCVRCDYPVQVFDNQLSSEDTEGARLFDETPGFLICRCCEQFELDLFTLFPIDDKHIYFQCMKCSLEMIVASKKSPPRFRSRVKCMLMKGDKSNFPEGFESFLTSELPENEFNRVFEVAKSRIEDKLDDVSKICVLDSNSDERRTVHKSATLTDLIDRLLANESLRANMRNALKKLPTVSSSLLGLIVGSQLKNPTVAKAVTIGSQAVIQMICDIILGELDRKFEKLDKEKKN